MVQRNRRVHVITACTLLATLLAGARLGEAAPTASTKCRSSKLLAIANEAKCLGSVYRKSMIVGLPPAPADVEKCASKLTGSFAKAESSAGAACPTSGDGMTIETSLRACIDDVVGDLGGPAGTGLPTDFCQSKKILKAGLYAQCRSITDAKALLKGVSPDFVKCIDKVTKAFDTLDAKSSCATTGDLSAIKGKLDTCAHQLGADLAVEAPFRLATINIVKPNFIAPVPGFPPSLYCGVSVNANVTSLIQTNIDSDQNGDTYRDLSLMIVQDSNEQVGTIPGTAAAANCANADPTNCAFTPGGFQPSVTFTNRTFGSCAVDSFSIPAGASGCFDTVPADFPVVLGPLTLSLKSTQAGGRYDANPANNIVNGRLRGFLPLATAQSTIVDPGTPLVGGQPISAILRGSQCGALSELVSGPGGVQGWWVEFDFTAQKATLP